MIILGIWSFIAIFYQTFLCVLISWLTLSCRLSPEATELAEVTLIKLLYLYDPEACGRIHFYNYTAADVVSGAGTAVVWPIRNDIAAAFRNKIKVWLVLHVIWAVLAVVNISQDSRPCSYYITLLPFTLVGLAILIVDVVFCALFLADIPSTGSETEILVYINSNKKKHLHSINVTLHRPGEAEDTSWIAVTLAYSSLRGIVQWILNLWIIKDSHFNGRALYNKIQHISYKRRSRGKSVQVFRIQM